MDTALTISFGVTGSDVNPAEISFILSREAFVAIRKGDVLADGGIASAGKWEFRFLESVADDLSTRLDRLIDEVKPAIKLLMEARAEEVYFLISVENHRELRISPETLCRLGSLPATIRVTYNP